MSQSLLPIRSSGPKNTYAAVVKAAHFVHEGSVGPGETRADEAAED
jgi:hypothetical protein